MRALFRRFFCKLMQIADAPRVRWSKTYRSGAVTFAFWLPGNITGETLLTISGDDTLRLATAVGVGTTASCPGTQLSGRFLNDVRRLVFNKPTADIGYLPDTVEVSFPVVFLTRTGTYIEFVFQFTFLREVYATLPPTAGLRLHPTTRKELTTLCRHLDIQVNYPIDALTIQALDQDRAIPFPSNLLR